MDFRSDTVTRPTDAMKRAMFEAEVGDDVYGDDPTVNRLQEKAAGMLGFEAALFTPTGTQANQIAAMSHCGRGDEVILGQQWHIHKYEAGGLAVLGSIQPHVLEHLPDGRIALADIEAAIKPVDDPHFARTRLVTMENTTNGRVLPLDYLGEVQALADRHGLSTHLDGARLFNAAVALAAADGSDPRAKARAIAGLFDSVSVCLSKGLGAPVGSVLCGSRTFIDRARRARKLLGGGMRQAGYLAAAGIYALDHHIDRLADDHANAILLAEGLEKAVQGNPALAGRVTFQGPHTNMLFTEVEGALGERLKQFVNGRGVAVNGRTAGGICKLRWVTHLDVTAEDARRAAAIVGEFR